MFFPVTAIVQPGSHTAVSVQDKKVQSQSISLFHSI